MGVFSIRTNEFKDKYMRSYVKQKMPILEEGKLIITPLTGTVPMNHRTYDLDSQNPLVNLPGYEEILF